MSQPVVIMDEAEAGESIKNDALCRRVGAALQRAYPGRTWLVRVTGGTVQIQCPALTNEYGYVLNADRVDIDRAAVMAGGMILEMFNLSRGRYATGGENALPRDARGNVIHTEAGWKPIK